MDFFSRFNTFTISNAIHNASPWREAWENKGSELSPDIPLDKIRIYYAELLSDGEEAISRLELLDKVPEPRLGCYYRAGICIRRMTRHPLYLMEWAETFSKKVPDDPEWNADV